MEAPLRLHQRVRGHAVEEGLEGVATVLDEVRVEDAVVLERDKRRFLSVFLFFFGKPHKLLQMAVLKILLRRLFFSDFYRFSIVRT